MNTVTLHPPRKMGNHLPEMGDLFIENNSGPYTEVYILAGIPHGPDLDSRKYCLVRLSDGFVSYDPAPSIKVLWNMIGENFVPWEQPVTLKRK